MARPRVLFFCHDGTGLGHLRRVSRLADELKERFSTLVLSGMREASWLVSLECGLVKLPDWDGIDGLRATRAGRAPWIDLSLPDAVRFRADAIRQLAQLYDPDVIIVDYRPFGRRRELDALFSERNSLRYFLHRGIADTSDRVSIGGTATHELAEVYDRILVAADPRIVDIVAEDDYCEEAAAKVAYVGFIAPKAARRSEQPAANVVCSGGGGHQAEELMLRCVEVAQRNPDVPVTIVLGPRSRLSAAPLPVPGNCEVYDTREDLPELHRDAAVVVTTGGYNSVLESSLGGARLIVYPSWTGDDDEQSRFADRVSRYHPLRRLEHLDALDDVLRAEWAEATARPTPALQLDTSGAERIGALLQHDLASRDSFA